MRFIFRVWLPTIIYQYITLCYSEETSRYLESTTADQMICVKRNATFIPTEDMMKRTPPLLLSFPGSGNTWVRLLLESLTGIVTGSIYDRDRELGNVFAAEGRCGFRMCAIKVHPADLHPMKKSGEWMPNGKWERKCRRGLLKKFTKVIFIARDPYRAVYSDFQRVYSAKHSGAINATRPKWKGHWEYYALNATQQWGDEWKNIVSRMYDQLTPLKRFHVVKYENLLSSRMRYGEIEKLMAFIGFPYSRANATCSFQLSENPRVHRKAKGVDAINRAYSTLVSSNLTCEIWKRVHSISERFQYPIWNNASCLDDVGSV